MQARNRQCRHGARSLLQRPYTRISMRAPQHNPSVACCADTAATADYAQLEGIQVNLDAFPQAEFFQVTAVLRPWRLKDVVQALSDHGVRGLTVSDVSGIGFQGGKERYAGTEFGESDLIAKKKIEIVCIREQVNEICRVVASTSFTGEVGDGKIFIAPVIDIVRIRTAETGGSAERMAGGLMDMLSADRQACQCRSAAPL
eukprot:TRINITY_DN4483_c0_g2_i3.p1 TRINITY_DN4483_c0_g2~~TRINITY_DN4483_c0_g2_i3.p1  ORF type:complete len:236 (+),score=13.94 TRINITY_DN4483_c0_g2_i3:106-708(+)